MNHKYLGNRLPKSTEESLTITTYISFFVVSFAFIYIFALWISPLYKNWYGCDASFFTLVGRGILNGKVPYRDFYDLKGPYFFFIQALGQLICNGHIGIFIIEIFSLFISLVLIYRIARLYINHKKTIGIIIFFLLTYISLLWGGNCLEEFTLPLNLLAIYLVLGYCDTSVNRACYSLISFSNPLRSNINAIGFITGLCFLIMCFSKITVAAPMAGAVLGMIIILLIHKEYKKLGFYIIYFVLGASVAILPLLIYFGVNESILKMLHCVFVFGMNRSKDFAKNLTFNLEIKLSGVIFAIIFSILHLIRPGKNKSGSSVSKRRLSTEQGLILLPMAVLSYLVLHLGDSFIYYFITGMPCMLLALIWLIWIYNPLILFYNVKQSICFILILVFIVHYAPDSKNTVSTFLNHGSDTFQEKYYDNAINMGLLIPDCDRDSVFSFDMDMQWFEINQITPCNKYVVNLQYFIALEPEIEDEIFDYFENTPPKWMICSNTLKDYLPKMEELVEEKYDCLYTTDIGRVFLLKEKHP